MRMGVRVVSVLSLAMSVAACISSSSVDCADGTTCPEGTACKLVPYLDAVSGSDCAALIAQPEQVCATPDQLIACSGLADRAACGRGSAGHCVSGVCIADTCGDCRVAGAEACDDGNTRSGDGCSFDCKSDETCGNHIVDVVRGEVCDDGNHLSHDGCDSRCQAEVPVWTELSNDHVGLPGSRPGAAMAYDARTGHVVLFGGFATRDDGTTVLSNDTWEWDGTGWSQMATPVAPTPRGSMAMAYSDALGEVVMFGGTDATHNKNNETWAWNGRRWTELAVPVAPAARDVASLAYDAKRGVLVLYGGQSVSIEEFDDTWELDATGLWTLSSASGPPGGIVPLSYDPARGVVIALDSETPPGTWGYDGQTWTELATGGLPTRTNATLAWDAATQTTLVFGGQGAGGDLSDQFAFDGSAWTAVVTGKGSPSARSGALVAGDPVRERVVMASGDGSDVDTTWEWTGTAWQPALGAEPNGGDVPLLAAPDRATGRTLLVNVLDAPATGHSFVFDGFAFGTTANPPESSDDAGALAWDDAADDAMLYLDGGDTFTWDGSAWTNVTPAKGATPTASGVIAAYDAARARVVLLDEQGDGSATATWLWDGAAQTWTLATPAHVPPSRQNTAMAYDPIREQVVLFSGGSASDTWLWDGADWTLAQPALAPTARLDATLAWNAARGALVLFGGASTDSWEWAGSAWTELDADGAPDARQNPSLWPTSSGDGVRLFGGLRGSHSTGGNDDHWLLRWQSADGIDEACQAHRDDDGDGLVGCDDPDCWATCTPACPPGEPCDTTAPRCGDGVCNAALENCRNCPQDCTCTAVCGDFVCDPGEDCAGDCGSGG